MPKAEQTEKKTIFQIIEDQQAVNLALEQLADGIETEDSVALLKSVAEECANAEKDKIDAYAGLIKAYSARAKIAKQEADCYKDEIDRLKGIAKALDGKADSLKSMLLEAMKLKGVAVLESELNKFRLMDASSEKLVLDDVPIAEVDPSFVKNVPTIDQDAVRAHLAMGGELEWARLVKSQYVRLF